MSKKILMFVIVLALLGGSAFSADSTVVGWKKSLVVDITTTQTGYSDSWVGGEAGSFNWVSNLNASAEKQLSPKFDFKSTLKVSFGQTVTQDEETKDWSRPKKSTDLIDFENVGRFTLHKFVDPYVAFRVETQFFDGRKIGYKQYFSPLKLTESAGLAKILYSKNDDVISSRFGVALRQIMKSNVDSTEIAPGEYGDFTTVDSTLTDGGLEWVSDATYQLHQNIKYTGKLTLYKALFFSKSEEVKGTVFEDDWKAVDANWENIFSAQVTKIITVNLYTQLLYDKEISKKGRFKETIAVGFVFKMI